MKIRFVPVVFLLLFATSLPMFAQWKWGKPRPPQSGACFYQDKNFGGNFFCLKDGDRWPSLPRGFNDAISSIRVFGGARLRIFRDGNFQGQSLLVDHDTVNLKDIPLEPGRSWNDRVSAIAVFRERDDWAPRGGPGGDRRDR
jgi:hypothetical protein